MIFLNNDLYKGHDVYVSRVKSLFLFNKVLINKYNN